MLLDQEVKGLLNQLAKTHEGQVVVDGIEITLHIAGGLLSLVASIWQGESYLPKSVRKCATMQPPFPKSSLQTQLTVDEEKFSVHLKFSSEHVTLTQGHFVDLLEEFSKEAAEWRALLDEKGRDDLLPVRAK